MSKKIILAILISCMPTFSAAINFSLLLKEAQRNLKAAQLNLYYMWHGTSLGVTYDKIITSSTVPAVTQEAIRHACSVFPEKLIKQIKFLVCDYDHPIGTPALTIPGMLIIYPIFFKLTLDEQIGIIAHELVHLRDHHPTKRMIVSAAGTAFYLYYPRFKDNNSSNSTRMLKMMAASAIYIGSLHTILHTIMNLQERSADIESAKALGNAHGLIAFFGRWAQVYKNAGLPTKSVIQDWIGMHPSFDTRIEYLTELQQKLDRKKELGEK